MHRTGRRPAARALAWAGALAVGAAALAGCTPGGQEEPAQDGSASPSETQNAIPQVDRDGYDPLKVYLVSPVWSAPAGTSGVRFGCQDLLVPVETVPTEADDPADMAIDFLLEDANVVHGDPGLSNYVAASEKTLTYTGHRTDGDTEVFEFSGTVSVQSPCDADRFRTQLEQTAKANTEAEKVRITVDGKDLEEVLQLGPLELGEEYTAPPAEEESASPSEGDVFGDPGAPSAPADGGDVPTAPGGEGTAPGAPAAPSAPATPSATVDPNAPAAPTAPGQGRPSLPGTVPSYGVETQPVVPPNGP